ncbi:MAG: DUF4169 family protein [Kordiimonadaceae bacterium]|nr:DUF4169 family protein [Kordiimonadaceae bacterium]
MAEILSFSKARKIDAKQKNEKRADKNRIKFGRTKAEKELAKSKQEKNKKKIDDHLIDR